MFILFGLFLLFFSMINIMLFVFFSVNFRVFCMNINFGFSFVVFLFESNVVGFGSGLMDSVFNFSVSFVVFLDVGVISFSSSVVFGMFSFGFSFFFFFVNVVGFISGVIFSVFSFGSSFVVLMLGINVVSFFSSGIFGMFSFGVNLLVFVFFLVINLVSFSNFIINLFGSSW